jgi:imidazolonepropionase-like amidohydrolase
METLVEAGLTPMETLVAATKIGAEFFQRQNDLGTVEEGKLADILVLDRDPLASISNTRSISTIVIDGRVIDPKTVPPLAKP